MNSILAKFKDRNIEEESNKCLAEVYVDGPTFDIDLISSDQKIVSAHKFVVCMFSDYLKEYLREFKPLGKACSKLFTLYIFLFAQDSFQLLEKSIFHSKNYNTIFFVLFFS